MPGSKAFLGLAGLGLLVFLAWWPGQVIEARAVLAQRQACIELRDQAAGMWGAPLQCPPRPGSTTIGTASQGLAALYLAIGALVVTALALTRR